MNAYWWQYRDVSLYNDRSASSLTPKKTNAALRFYGRAQNKLCVSSVWKGHVSSYVRVAAASDASEAGWLDRGCADPNNQSKYSFQPDGAQIRQRQTWPHTICCCGCDGGCDGDELTVMSLSRTWWLSRLSTSATTRADDAAASSESSSLWSLIVDGEPRCCDERRWSAADGGRCSARTATVTGRRLDSGGRSRSSMSTRAASGTGGGRSAVELTSICCRCPPPPPTTAAPRFGT